MGEGKFELGTDMKFYGKSAMNFCIKIHHMNSMVQFCLTGMKWFLIFFIPLMAFSFSYTLLKETLFPWNLASTAMKESVPNDWYFCVGFENSTITTNESTVHTKRRTYLSVPTSFDEKRTFEAQEVNDVFSFESIEGNPWAQIVVELCILGFLWWFTLVISFSRIYRLFIKVKIDPNPPALEEQGTR